MRSLKLQTKYKAYEEYNDANDTAYKKQFGKKTQPIHQVLQ